MATQQWQQINPNFAGANNALAVASNAFSGAGQLAKGLIDSINATSKAKQIELQTAYNLDKPKRNALIEQYNYNLAQQRNQDEANALMNVFNQSQAVGQANLLAELNNATGSNYTTLPEDLNQKFERRGFVNRAYEGLLNTGQYSNPSEALALAKAEADRRLGALPTLGVLDKQQEALTEKYKADNKLLSSFLNSTSKGGTTVNVGGTKDKNGDYIRYSDKNDPEKNEKWIKNTFDENRGLFDALAVMFNDDMALNQNIIRRNQLKYEADFGVRPAQFRAYINGAMKDGKLGDLQIAESIFEGTKEEKAQIAEAMKKFGHDKTSTKITNNNSNSKSAVETLKAQYNAFEKLLAKSDTKGKKYVSAIQSIYNAANAKTKKQIISAYLASKAKKAKK